MSKKINIFDTTLRDGLLTPNFQIKWEQKLKIFHTLVELGVDTIEAGYSIDNKQDLELLKWAAQNHTDIHLCGIAGHKKEDIQNLRKTLQSTNRKRIHLYTPVTFENQMGLDKNEIIQVIKDSIHRAKEFFNDIEWSAYEATQANLDFLCQAIEIAIECGANTISIPDTLGIATLTSFRELLSTIQKNVSHLKDIKLSVYCHNDNGLASVLSLDSLHYDVSQIECTINGIGARYGNASLQAILNGLGKEEFKNYHTQIDEEIIHKISEMVKVL